jgi:hypothetical protein
MTNTYRKLTPEEKLLHVIERPDTIEKLNLNKKKKIGRPHISLREVNKALIALSGLFVLIFVIYFVKEDAAMQKRFEDLKISAKGEAFDTSIKRDRIPLLSKYIEDTGKNNPFDVLPDVVPETAAEAAPEPVVTFKLVGIIWSGSPQAIIEDESSLANHLVSEGDKINDYTVSEISQDSVKLISGNVETTLK